MTTAGYKWRDPGRRRRRQPPATPTTIICAAITDPGRYTDRRMHEHMTAWQARAILTAIEPHIRADERRHLIEQARAKQGDELALIVAEIISEQP